MLSKNGIMEKSINIERYFERHSRFLAFNALFALAFMLPLWELAQTSYSSDIYSYIPFVPFISAYLMYANRETIFSQKRSWSVAGLVPIIIGIGGLFFASELLGAIDDINYLSLIAFSIILIWIGGFVLCYGIGPLRAAAVPMLFLFLMAPIPAFVLDRIIAVLQSGSTYASFGFLKLLGVPVARDGYVFHLPGINIEVAKECSGIRSAISLLITGLLAGHFFLRTGWSKFTLLVLVVPLTILKNGFRIALLSFLGVYVDRRILGSELHRNGGILFFILALVVLWGIIVVLRKFERSLPLKSESAACCCQSPVINKEVEGCKD
jgi:exosortase